MGLSAAEAAELAARRARIMAAMDGGVMLLAAAPERVRSADVLYPYRQDSDFGYVTAFPEADAVCLLAPEAPERYVLFVRPHDPERAIWIGARVGIEGAVQQYGADAAFPLDELEQVLPRFLEKAAHVYHSVAREDPLAARLLAGIRRAQAARPRSGTGPTAIRDPADILHELRLRKEPAELARLRQAIAIACEAHREAMRTARPGMNEFEVEALIDFTFRRRGAVGPAYASIVAGGASRAWCSRWSPGSTCRPTPRTCRRRSAASASASRTTCSSPRRAQTCSPPRPRSRWPRSRRCAPPPSPEGTHGGPDGRRAGRRARLLGGRPVGRRHPRRLGRRGGEDRAARRPSVPRSLPERRRPR